ncbi:uncharacterized protein PG998_001476 [Apiospora kogelbergensis]|uniref:BTB domain-containing protein n=1 Tax=Apiospora kogelbergensis TaxID=1337665 RepID=A0AAW0QQK1_9PEZI
MDIELDMEDGAGTHPSPIVESEASIHEDDELIDIEDVVLEYKGIEYPCNAQTLMQGSKVLSETLQDYDASQFRPQVFNVPTFSECGSPEAFYATLEVCYSGSWTREQEWELHMSYLSCVKVWLIGHHFGIDAMKDIAVTKAASVTEELTKHFIQLSESHERECERAHLASLTRAVKLANRHEWHAALWKMLYDAGEAVAPKLLCHPSFQLYIKTDEGQDYARAIRVSDRVKAKAEAGRGRGNGGVTKRPARGGRRGRKVFGRGQRLSWQ